MAQTRRSWFTSTALNMLGSLTLRFSSPAGTSAGLSTRYPKRRWMLARADWGFHQRLPTRSPTSTIRAPRPSDHHEPWRPGTGKDIRDWARASHRPDRVHLSKRGGRIQSARLDGLFRYRPPRAGNDRCPPPAPPSSRSPTLATRMT